ncbi:MAG TPA: DUF6049 family protein [Marmoricola sp.]|nr:DUF6049 family protein [Marmoricola sp.]
MTAARLLAPALALIMGAVTALTGAVEGPAAAVIGGPEPLSVHIDRLNRATIPRHGRLVVTGTVTNDSSEVWQDINVHPVTSAEPMTTRAELARAAATPADTYIGDRLYAPHDYASIGDLSPGDSAHFRISLPRRVLAISGAPGVYWFGVQALGTDTQGRDDLADGRARTFLPLLPRRAPTTQAAVVVPLREEVRRDPTGALLDLSTWADQLSPGGLLERQLAFVESAAGLPLTWLVDPAVLRAADDVAHGNPPLSYGEPTGSTATPTTSPTPSPSATGTPSGSATGSPSPPRSPDASLPVTDSDAAHWLDRTRAAMAGQSVLGLPYADPDVVTLGHRGPDLLRQARSVGEQTFASYGVVDTPAVAPVDGVLDHHTVQQLPHDTTVLVSDRGRSVEPTQWRAPTGQGLVFTDQRAASGGPAPTPPLDALALRQRIVAAAALRALHHQTSPMVVVLPSSWDPGTAWQQARFFPGLAHLRWLQLTSVTPDPVAPTRSAPLDYPRSAVRARIHRKNVDAARRLVTTGQTLASVLATTNNVADEVSGAALAAVSYHARDAPRVARQQVDAFNQSIQHTLAGISLSGTDLSTLSGGSGSLTVSLYNGLDLPVTVGLRAHTDSPQVRIETPRPVQIGAGQRTTIRLATTSRAVGVHRITLVPVSTSGEPVGLPLVFSLRTSDVGRWIWLILGAGGALLVFAILRRLVRRLSAERRR